MSDKYLKYLCTDYISQTDFVFIALLNQVTVNYFFFNDTEVS